MGIETIEVTYKPHEFAEYTHGDLRELLADAIIELPPARMAGLLGCILERLVDCNKMSLDEALLWADSNACDVEVVE